MKKIAILLISIIFIIIGMGTLYASEQLLLMVLHIIWIMMNMINYVNIQQILLKV